MSGVGEARRGDHYTNKRREKRRGTEQQQQRDRLETYKEKRREGQRERYIRYPVRCESIGFRVVVEERWAKEKRPNPPPSTAEKKERRKKTTTAKKKKEAVEGWISIWKVTVE